MKCDIGGKHMKKIKKLFLMIFLMILEIGISISNNIIDIQAFSANDNFYYTADYQLNILYWYPSSGDCETILLEIGTNLKNNQPIWIARSKTKIYDYGIDFPIIGNLYNGECIVPILSSNKEWYYFIAENDYFAIIQNGNFMPCEALNINCDIRNFDTEFEGYGGIYFNENIINRVEIDKNYYFKNLHKNIGNNINGSCAYVALGSLLSYYDIFYNDDIIPDTYILNGATKKFIEDEYIHQLDITTCSESPGYTESFHQFLINEIGKKVFNYNYSITYQQVEMILNYYLANFANLSQNEYSIQTLNTESSIINSLNQNHPVFLAINSWATNIEVNANWNIVTPDYLIQTAINNGHAVVAYGYEVAESGKIYYKCHSGWLNSQNNTETIYLPYDNLTIGLVLNIEKNNNNCSRAYVYKNQDTGEEYSICPKCENYTKDDIYIHCRSDVFEHTVYLNAKKRITYEFNTECMAKYDLSIETNNLIDMLLYDEDNHLIEIGAYIKLSENKYDNFIVKDLSKGAYKLRVQFINPTENGIIHTTIQPRNTTPIPDITELSEVDILPHLHDNHNVFRIYTNQNKLYQMKLVATSTNTIEYPEGAITITDVEGNLINRLPNIDTLKATTSNTNNTLLFYAEQWKSYNIHINYNKTGITSLKLYLTTQEDLPTTTITNNDLYLERCTMTKGDGGKIITIKRVGTYQFYFNYKGTQTTNTYVTIMKEIEGTCTVLTTKALNKTDRSLNYTHNITEPTNIIVCYHNSVGNEAIDIDIGKELTEIFTIQTDISSVDCGSEVRLNNGALRGTTITQGHTRNAYLGENAPDRSSRLNYYWYSLDESIAKVSAYGTITGVGVGTTTIQAVYKTDPSKVAELEITVIPYTIQEEPTYIQYGMDVRTEGTISGTEITSGKGEAIPIGVNPEVTIHQGYTRLICLGNDSPSSNIQDYEWTVLQEEGDTGMVTVSSYGTMTGTQEGYVTVKGIYKYNPNYQVSICVQILN